MYNYLFIKKDMDNFAKVNVIYSKYFNSEDKPARSTVAVKTLPKNAKVEIECIAFVPKQDKKLQNKIK